MTNEQGFFRCPDGDGILLNGAALQQIKQGQLTIALGKSRKPHRPASLTCPSCGKPMTHVAYDGGPTTIDSCTNCPYRWLDAGEAAALTVR
jgi:hypothetical protein